MGKIKRSMYADHLEKLRKTDIGSADFLQLRDISEIDAGCGEPVTQRILNYLYRVKNPYVFRVGNTRVKIVFSGEYSSEKIENALEKILRQKI